MMPGLRLSPVFVLSVLGFHAFAQSSPPATAADQRAVIDRLLRANTPGSSNTLTLGAVPDSLPVAFGPAVQVQATVRSVGIGGVPGYRIFAVSGSSLDDTRRDLAHDLQASGWQSIDQPPTSGFRPSADTLAQNFQFVHQGKVSLLLGGSVQAVQGRVELDLNVSPASAEVIGSLKKRASSTPRSSMPALLPPSGVNVISYAANYASREGQISSARVQTNLSANEVLSAYSAQLKRAGWRAVTDTRSGELRVVTYQLTDLGGHPAVGVLGVRTQASGDYILTVSVSAFDPF